MKNFFESKEAAVQYASEQHLNCPAPCALTTTIIPVKSGGYYVASAIDLLLVVIETPEEHVERHVTSMDLSQDGSSQNGNQESEGVVE